MKNYRVSFKIIIAAMLVMLLGACGQKVEVPPAHFGKIMTKDGYQEALIPTSKFRLDPCWTYCDRLVLLDVSDKAFVEPLEIFIPKDKLNLGVQIQTTLSINPNKTAELFNSLSPEQSDEDYLSTIALNKVYNTYAKQIILAETREYLSQFSIGDIASSVEQVNAELRVRLTDALAKRTPFSVRYVGITDTKYPAIITEAQENAAKRREQIQQEEAQLAISTVSLEREYKEKKLQRQIEKEIADTKAEAIRIAAKAEAEAIKMKGDAEAEAIAARAKALAVNPNLVALTWAERWSGTTPTTMLGDAVPFFNVDGRGK